MKKAWLSVPLLVVLLVMPATASAQEDTVPRLRSVIPTEAAVGQEEPIYVYLNDAAGQPVAGARIIFQIDTSFLNSVGDIDIGQAITDEDGLASFQFVPRRAGDISVTARFPGSDLLQGAFETQTVVVEPGTSIYTEPAPTRIPGLNYRLLVVLLSGVWGLYLVAIGYLWKASRVAVRESVSGADRA